MKLAGGTFSRRRPKSVGSHQGSPGALCSIQSWKKGTGSPTAAVSHLPTGRTSVAAATTRAPRSRAPRTARHPSSWWRSSYSQAIAVSSANAPPGYTTASRKFEAVTWRPSALTKSGASCATAHCVMPR